MPKRIVLPLFLGFLALSLFSPAALAAPKSADGGVRLVKLATLSMEDISWGKGMKKFVFPEVDRITSGRIKIKMYWGGVLGDEDSYIKKMKEGMLGGGGFTAQGVMAVCPETAVLSLPFLFNGWDEVDHVREVMQPVFERLVEERGYYLMLWMDQDFDQVFSNKLPMTTLSDFRKSRFITWCGPVEEAFLKTLGAPYVPADVPQVSAIVRAGKVDAAIGPSAWVVGAQLQGVIRYINPVKIRYMLTASVLTQDLWKSLNPEWRKKFGERQKEIQKNFCRFVRAENDRFLSSLFQYGIRRSELSTSELSALKASAQPVWAQLTGKMYPKSLLDQVTDTLASFRRRK